MDYNLEVTASEAPVKNYVAGGEILPFEYVVAESEILEKEIIKFNQKIKEIFGKKYDLKLNSIRLCVGTDENYVTIDESNLKEVDIIPTIQGLQEFIQANKKSVFGFTIRRYDTKKGNLIFCECELNHPIFDIQSIKIKILASLSQRGLYMQKHHVAYGLHVYYILNVSRFSDMIIRLFNELNIPIEMIYLKRKSSIQNWRATECELDEKNLKNYLQFNYTHLSHSDVDQVVSIVRENKFNFEFANMMADLLNKMKLDRIEIEDALYSLGQEDIAAAAKVVVNYFGFNEQNLSLPSNLDFNIIKKSIDELDRYIH
ncbi:MAG: hypothetical protein HWN66_15345 [Candidatus Helarchaeota archaeon]|nr:hypothetical protein [Candidatus Helarchaeota archaeon]